MSSPYVKIRNRYGDVISDVNDVQMFQDIQTLIGYIEALHQVILAQAATRAAEEALEAFSECDEKWALPN
jgi:hypothetical protein